jgi:uncharacterized membrane protein
LSPDACSLRVDPKYPITYVASQQTREPFPMHLVIIGWLYVALMMSVAEATNPVGTVLGAIVTFVLYGVLPVSILMYLMGTPARKRAIKAREAAELARERGQSGEPDGPGEPSADAVAPVRKEP